MYATALSNDHWDAEALYQPVKHTVRLKTTYVLQFLRYFGVIGLHKVFVTLELRFFQNSQS